MNSSALDHEPVDHYVGFAGPLLVKGEHLGNHLYTIFVTQKYSYLIIFFYSCTQTFSFVEKQLQYITPIHKKLHALHLFS